MEVKVDPVGMIFFFIVIAGMLFLRSQIKRSGNLGSTYITFLDWYYSIKLLGFLVFLAVVAIIIMSADKKKKKS
tara:strand:- start:277 stop:498 length:222 start_codon:yes stop_codon:yes gene_type:complete